MPSSDRNLDVHPYRWKAQGDREEAQLERLRVAVQQSVDRQLYPFKMGVVAAAETISNRLVLRLVADFWASDVHVVEHRYPETWLDALLERFAPRARPWWSPRWLWARLGPWLRPRYEVHRVHVRAVRPALPGDPQGDFRIMRWKEEFIDEL